MNRQIIQAWIPIFAALITGCADHSRDPNNIAAPPVITDILSAWPGYTGDQIGTMVEQVSSLTSDDFQTIRLEVPLVPEKIDAVDVFNADNKLIEQEKRMQVVALPRIGYSSLEIYLPKSKNLRFQLHIIDLVEN
ncbi:MAG: hypothetical protein AAF353_06035 [Pseudomonadota bacterium]